MAEENHAPATGIAGTVLGSIGTAGALGLFNGGLGGLFGNGNTQNLQIELAKKDAELALAKSENLTDAKLVNVFTELRKLDKQQDANVAALQLQVANMNAANAALVVQVNNLQNTLAGITKCVVPNSSVCPGWGNVTITPSTSSGGSGS